MTTPDIENLLAEIKEDKQELSNTFYNYQEKIKSKLSSPWALGAAFVGGLILSRFRLGSHTDKSETAANSTSQPIIETPGVLATLTTALLPKLLWTLYEEFSKKQITSTKLSDENNLS